MQAGEMGQLLEACHPLNGQRRDRNRPFQDTSQTSRQNGSLTPLLRRILQSCSRTEVSKRISCKTPLSETSLRPRAGVRASAAHLPGSGLQGLGGPGATRCWFGVLNAREDSL